MIKEEEYLRTCIDSLYCKKKKQVQSEEDGYGKIMPRADLSNRSNLIFKAIRNHTDLVKKRGKEEES